MIKVLHVVLGLQVGGLEKFVIDLISAMSDRVDSKVLCLETMGGLGGTLSREKVVAIKKRSGLHLGVVSEIRKIAQREQVELIHTHNPSPHFYGALTGLICGIPVVHTKHGRNYPKDPKKVLLNRISSLLSRRIVAVSEDAANVCRDIEKIRPEKIRTILNGINPDVFLPKKERCLLRELGVPDDCPVIGIVARLAPEKDHLTLLKACSILKETDENFRLVVVGDGLLRGELEGFAARKGLAENVIFTGTRHDVGQLVPEFDVFALSSTTEGVSLTLLEAMSCQVPVVATNVGGNPEVVFDGSSGFIVPESDPGAMAQKLSLLLDDHHLRTRMGKVGRKIVLERFSIQKTAQAYLDLYNEVLR